MYVRWVVRGHKNSEIANVNFHDAYLVESFRDENGSPRQRTISYLGNIRQIDDEFPTIEREIFLLRAELILDSLDEVSPNDKRQVMSNLHDRVQPVNADEVMLGFANTLRWYCRWWISNGKMPTEDELMTQIRLAQDTVNQILLDD